MNKSEFIAAIADRTGETKRATESTLNALVEVVTEAVAKGDDVRIADFFMLSVERREAKTGRNPSTGETIQIPAKNTVKIKASKALLDAANGK